MPDQILIVLFAELKLYRFRAVGDLFPELLSILEECGATGWGCPAALRISRILEEFLEKGSATGLGVPDQILIVLFAELKLYGFRPG